MKEDLYIRKEKVETIFDKMVTKMGVTGLKLNEANEANEAN